MLASDLFRCVQRSRDITETSANAEIAAKTATRATVWIHRKANTHPSILSPHKAVAIPITAPPPPPSTTTIPSNMTNNTTTNNASKIALLCLLMMSAARGLSLNGGTNQRTRNVAVANEGSSISRRDVMFGVASALVMLPIAATADEGTATACNSNKQCNLSNEELAAAITKDVVENQFLVRADITRSLYDESATFTDEIDTYKMDQWIKGTKKLFVANNSDVRLVADSVKADATKVEFRFDEDLQFNIPFRPTVYLSGRVELKRDPSTGLITSYQEFWDQSVTKVLKTAKF